MISQAREELFARDEVIHIATEYLKGTSCSIKRLPCMSCESSDVLSFQFRRRELGNLIKVGCDPQTSRGSLMSGDVFLSNTIFW